MEILEVFAHQYVERVVRLQLSIELISENSIWDDGQHRAQLLITLDELGELCRANELPVTKIRIDHVTHCLREGEKQDADGRAMRESFSDELLASYLADMRQRMTDELSTKLFFQLPYSRKEMFEKPREKWKSVIDRWPETTGDIEEANKCFALSRYAAAVFHCVQIIEHGLLHLGTFLGVTDPHSGWTAVANKLKKIIDTEHSKRTDKERTHYAFIEQMQAAVEALKNAWRNKISHAHGKLILMGSDFTPDIAEEIMTASRSFMRRLAEELPN